MPLELNRRTFVKNLASSATALTVGGRVLAAQPSNLLAESHQDRPEYRGPTIIIVRFGGGVRRRETIDPQHTYSPFLLHDFSKRGVLFPNMEISSIKGVETGHGQGTLNILTGKYDQYKDVEDRFLGERFEAKVPTLFEYLRKQFAIPEHQTLIVNGEDRINEEFYTFSNHHLFGVNYRSNVISLYRFKIYLLRHQIQAGQYTGQELQEKRKTLEEMESQDYRATERGAQSPEIEAFWQRWERFYGDTGFVNPRGDRLLTELTLQALRQLRPKLIMVNYNDCDYVHWGNLAHYTRGIAIMDAGLRQLVAAVEADDAYRDNTLFVVVPDCGRDSNRFVSVPCQHHFGTRSAHELFALFFGKGIASGQIVDKPTDQISVAATIGKLAGFNTEFTEGSILSEVFA